VANEPVKQDKGAHYRYKMGCPECKTLLSIDPYRVADVVGPMDGPAFHMMKKLMRGAKKGHTKRALIEELFCCLERWKQLEQEKGEWEEGS